MSIYNLVYLGYNNMFTHKRGVENVIQFQSHGSPFNTNYYLHWDFQNRVYRYQQLICIGVKKNIFWFISMNVILLRLRSKNKIFVHSHNPLMSIMSMYQSNLFTAHDGLYYLAICTKHKMQMVFWVLEKLLYFRCNYVHFISGYTKSMSLYHSSKNFVIIPNTSHFESYKKFHIVINELNLKKFTTDAIKVFIVRSIEERALVNLIIGVAEKLESQNFEFIIAGKGPLLNFYREKINKLGLENITLLGYVSDDNLIKYYQECDLVLMPAAYGEGFGLPIIEGYLYNKPVVSSNVCAIPEVIISEYFLFENTIESIITTIHFAIDQNQFQYRSYYDENFSNKVVISKMNTLYKNLL